MNLRKPALSALFICLLGAGFSGIASAASPSDAATLDKIRDAAMQSDYSYQRLEDLTDLVGPRLSGSAGGAAAVEQVAAAMRALGAKVTLQPVKVPHWVRGEEKAELVDYKGRPGNITQKVVLTALGGSGATPAAGLTAPIVIVHDFEELKSRAAEVKGAIVLFDWAFDQDMADRGLAGPAYGQGSRYRTNGPRLAAELGALAAMVRSVGGADFRLPHTGATNLNPAQRIPAAAVTAEDAMLIARLMKRGPVKMKLTLTPKMLADADSFNVIADLPGTEKPDEVVIVSGHLDSWDLATGAHDDGTGVTTSMGVLHTLKQLGLQPRRTIRMVAWANEENGLKGGTAYFEANKGKLEKQIAAIETDGGVTGRTYGIMGSVRPEAEKYFSPLMNALLPIGAGVFSRRDSASGSDVHQLEANGVPAFEPYVDTSAYFNYHHTPADTFDKVDPENMKRHVAVLSALSWYLANTDDPIGRSPEQQK